MQSFGILRLPHTILFGSGQRGAIGKLAAGIGNRALLCTDARLASDRHFTAIAADLKANGVSVLIYDQSPPDLPIEAIADAAEQARAWRPDVVVGIGGGSCMDMAKTLSMVLKHGGHLRDYYGEWKVPGPILPVIAVPTTAGTGSEVTPVAVVSDAERGTKVGISSPYLIPVAAICDPELTLSCPPALTASVGADALTHAIESFTALSREATPTIALEHVFVGKNALTDHFGLLAIRSIWQGLERAYHDGSDLEARELLMLGALAAGCAFGSAGTAAAHALQYPVGNATHTPHGVGVAALLPYVMEFNRSSSVKPFADIARAIGLEGSDDETLSHAIVDEVARLLEAVGIPRSLAELGLPGDLQDWTAENAMSATRLLKNNPRTLDQDALTRITRAAYAGDRLSLAN